MRTRPHRYSTDIAFSRALDFLYEVEGGYANVKGDRGGPTFRGITQGTYDAYRKMLRVEPRDVRQLTWQEWEAVLFQRYWLPMNPQLFVGQPMTQLALFDCAVNSGPHRAWQLYDETRHRVGGEIPAHYGDEPFFRAYLAARRRYYWRLALKPSQMKFLRGWINRLRKLKRFRKLVQAAPLEVA